MDTFVLGISAFAHEASACLLHNGKVVAFAEEERFNRQRHSSEFPLQAIQFCLNQGRIQLSQVDQISFFWNPWLELPGNALHFLKYFPQSLDLLKAPAGTTQMTFFERMRITLNLKSEIQKRFPQERVPPIYFCEHHSAHGASAFYPSGFDSAAFVTIDGRGESVTTTTGYADPNGLHRHTQIKVPHSLGHFYSAITDYLGFKPFFDEWKVMGLSAYGDPQYDHFFEKLVIHTEQGFELNLKYFSFHTKGTRQWVSELFLKEFGLAQGDFQKSANIARAAQKSVERAGVHLTKRLYERTKTDNLCMAGGVVLNCLMNQKIVEQSGFHNFFFQPLANDAGTSMGSAQYWWHQVQKQPRVAPQTHISWGPSYTSKECRVALEKYHLPFRKSGDICGDTARLLYEGCVVGWFQGGMEAGPRALGHRSILADPSRADMKEKINRIIKKRESFRPFAPSVLADKSNLYFKIHKNLESPYMILAGDVRSEWRDRLPAITHVDGTARIQTVTAMHSLRYYELIRKFGDLSGIYVLLNTSFNENEPIVCQPEEAIECFLRSDLDALVLEDLIVLKEDVKAPNL